MISSELTGGEGFYIKSTGNKCLTEPLIVYQSLYVSVRGPDSLDEVPVPNQNPS